MALRWSKSINRLVTPFNITFVVTLVILSLYLLGVEFLELIELKAYDLRLRARGIKQPSGHVALAVIDEKSLKELGKWPWPRKQIAKLIDYLSEDGAAVIGFDVGFLEPDEHSALNLLEEIVSEVDRLEIRDQRIKQVIQEKRQEADNDYKLKRSMEESNSPIILGFFFHMSQDTLDFSPSPDEIKKNLKAVENATYPLVLYESEVPKQDLIPKAFMPQPNIPLLSKVADGQGYFNMMADKDGLVRWMPLVLRCQDNIYLPLSIQSLRYALGSPPLKLLIAQYGVKGVILGKLFIPTNERGQLLINYLGPEKTFPHYSITDILNGRIKKGEFEGKIVLVGATAIGIYDMRNTPFSPVYPGLEIHATIIDNVITGQFLSRPRWGLIIDFIIIIVLSSIMVLIIPRTTAFKSSILSLSSILVYSIINVILFWKQNFWINIVYPVLNGFSVYISLTIYKYITEEKEKKKIRSAFSYYVAPAVVNEMLKNPEKLKLGGDKKELTVLFSDIRGFTSISEKMDPEELVKLLNEYLTEMTNIVFRHGGTLDKYMGDAIMAIYGAPLEQEDHAHRACRTALDMLKSLELLNQKWQREGKKRLEIGIGINTGDMMVGNMGSLQRFDYTVMGDAVNLGSRLEGANKSYMTNILISETTYEKVKEDFICLEVDSVRVKGKALPVKVYTILGEPQELPEIIFKAKEIFEKALSDYKRQDWDSAATNFREVLRIAPKLKVAEVYLKRCSDLKESPPGPDWDGVYEMKTK